MVPNVQIVRYEDHGYHNLSDTALCDTSACGELRSKETDHVAFRLVPAELLNSFQMRAPLLTALPLLSSLLIHSLPGGHLKCHRQDCKMGSVLRVTVIASRKCLDNFGLGNELIASELKDCSEK